MAPLAKWSTLGVMLLPLVIFGVVVRLPAYAPPLDQIPLGWWSSNTNFSWFDFFRGVAILGLSFGCSQNVFGIYLSQRDQRPSRFLLANEWSIAISFTINMSFAVLGYLCFGNKVQANILLDFAEDDTVINLVRFVLCLFMVITIP